MSSSDKVNILVVDDLPEKLLVMQSILEELGENIISVQSGREALRHLLDRDFAVVLLDVNMPDMDGFETAALLRQRKRCKHTPIIFITAFADEMHTAQGYSLGAVDYIPSPVVPDVLRTKVHVFADLFRMNEQVKRQAEERINLAKEQAARAAAEDASRRSTFLAEASRILASSLDYEVTLRGLLRLAVPFLGDVSALTLLDDQGGLGQTEVAWVDQAKGSGSSPLAHPGALPVPLAEALQRVVAARKSEYLPALCHGQPQSWAACCRAAETDPDWLCPDFALHAAILLPLLARGKTLGVLTLSMGPSGRQYSPADLALAEDLASRAAIALDNARLYRNIQEEDRRKNEFLAMLAHELRNPLAPIRNAVTLLRMNGSFPPQLEWARDMIERQVLQLVRLVDDLLDISRITRGKINLQMECLDLATVVARAVETSRPLIEARRHELLVALPPKPVWVAADAARLAQVLANLLNNAAKYTEEGGRIWLTVERDQEEAVVRVRDSGIGIPREMLSCVFDLFTQVDHSLDRSQGGLGIGLTLVRRLVEMHQGSVQAFSEGSNRGSEFVVRLPTLPEGSPTLVSENGTGPAGAKLAHRRILIVDDNVDAAESLALLLRLGGQEVRVVHDGLTALDVARTFRPDVVLLDIGLPGMDGYEVARRLRRQPGLEQLLLVALTGYGQEEDRQRTQEAGFDHHLVKPVNPEILPALFASTQAAAL